MMKFLSSLWIAVVLGISIVSLAACDNEEPASKVNFIEPQDGAEVVSPFTVRMGTEEVTVEPASQGVRDGYGHHHLIVDADLPPLDQPIPSDERHLHFGGGQMETTLDLPPGEHKITLLFAQGNHVSYAPAITDTITITVVE